MPISFTCGSCGRNLKTPESMAGKKGKCPHCGAVMEIPAQSKDDDPFDLGSSKSSPPPAKSSNQGSNDLWGDAPSAASPKAPAANPFTYQSSSPYASSVAPSASRPGTSGRAVASLVCGIFGIVISIGCMICCCLPFGPIIMSGGAAIGAILGIIAWVLGYSDLKANKTRSSNGVAIGGLVCGIIATICGGLLFIFSVVMLVIGTAAFMAS